MGRVHSQEIDSKGSIKLQRSLKFPSLSLDTVAWFKNPDLVLKILRRLESSIEDLRMWTFSYDFTPRFGCYPSILQVLTKVCS